jgi:ABC-type antimicrobial peptide transport system permease subunit
VSEQLEPLIYGSFFQQADSETIIQVRTNGNPIDISPAVEKAVHQIDSQIPIFDVRSMREAGQMASIFVVMQSTFAGIFGVIALILAATGIYGVVAYRTELRTHEIGVRVALGASRADIVRLVLQQGLWLTIIGLALGLLLAFVLSRFIVELLYGVSANDPVTVGGVFLLLGAMSLLACYLPAHRAMRLDPVSAIREQ